MVKAWKCYGKGGFELKTWIKFFLQLKYLFSSVFHLMNNFPKFIRQVLSIPVGIKHTIAFSS